MKTIIDNLLVCATIVQVLLLLGIDHIEISDVPSVLIQIAFAGLSIYICSKRNIDLLKEEE